MVANLSLVLSTSLVAASVAFLIHLLLKRRAKSLRGSKWPLDEWLEQHSEEAIDPDREIIDPHHHLWDFRCQPKGAGIPQWFFKLYLAISKPRDICERFRKMAPPAVINSFAGKSGRQFVFLQPYMGPELLLDIRNRDSGKRGHNVVQTVYLECGWKPAKVEEALQPVGEAHMVEEVHKAFPSICNGVVAFANLRLPDVEKTLKAYGELKSVKGIRHAIAWTSDDSITGADATKGMAREPDFRRGFALLQKYGLSYDTWMFHEQLEDVTDLAKAFPETTIIVDHVAQPLGICSYTREGTFPTWEKGIRELAKASEKVHVKLSGLAMCNLGFRLDEGPRPPTSAKLAELWGPYIRLCLEAFGVRRCMFASNFPVDKVSCDYTVMWNAFKLIVKDYSDDDKAALFHDNAKRVYRL